MTDTTKEHAMERPRLCATHRSNHLPGCPECRRYLRERWHWHKHGTISPPSRTQPASLVRDHIRSLLDAGMRLEDIATDAGMATRGQLGRVMYSKRANVTNAVADRIFAVRPRTGDRWLIDATGLRRRAQALARGGWALTGLAVRLGYAAPVGPKWAVAMRTSRATHDKVAALYDEVSPLDGPSPRAARLAHRRGWHPPEAWSDATIDDPSAAPYQWCRDVVDEVAVRRALHGEMRWSQLSDPDRAEVARRVLDAGHGFTRLRHLVKVDARVFDRWCARTGFVAPGRAPEQAVA